MLAFEEDGEEGARDVIKQLTAFDYLKTSSVHSQFVTRPSDFRALLLDPEESERGYLELQSADGRIAPYRGRALLLDRNTAVELGRGLELHKERIRNLALTIFLALLCATTLTLRFGTAQSRKLTRRIEDISAATDAVALGTVEVQFPQSGAYDELDQIAASLTSMAKQIRKRFENHRRFSDQLAHELRTPLARLSSKLGELGDADAIERLDLHIQNVSRTLNDMLELGSIINNEGLAVSFEEYSVHALIAQSWEAFEDAADEKDVEADLVLDGPSHMVINDLLVRRLLINLIDNAVGNVPIGGRILVHSDLERGVVVDIRNSGSAFPAHVLASVQQSDPYATDQIGHGLGLSFVKAICNLHGWTLTLFNEDGYACTVVSV